jgi:hypothetical protein
MEPSEHQKQVRKVLEGNERVWFHPEKDRLAIWYGGLEVTIVDSCTFNEIDSLMLNSYDRSIHENEDALVVELVSRGYDRVGRTQDDTRVLEQ